jgi:hypothetical protein
MLSSWRMALCAEPLAAVTLRLQICRDGRGLWSVQGLSPQPVPHFASLSASVDYARRECAEAPATIELMVDGFYAVVHQESGWPQQLVAPEAELPLETADRTDSRSPRPFKRLRDWLSSGW